MAFLDLSAAFDVVDHDILLQRLKLSQGIADLPLEWIRSYLQRRIQQVVINDSASSVLELDCGMPQGSMIGPKMYKKFTETLGIVARLLQLLYHFYADDSHFGKASNPRLLEDVMSARDSLENALSMIADWMYNNKLKLNHSKTEFLVVGTAPNRKRAGVTSLQVCDTTVQAVDSARSLGVELDCELKKHISQVVKKCRYHIWLLWQIQKYLTPEIAKSLVHSYIISRLDYCNSLYLNFPKSTIKPLQDVMNEAARLITLTSRHQHFTPVLKQLHWLPVKYRIEYKTLVITYNAIQGNTASYLTDLLKVYSPRHQLRSSKELLLETPKYKLKSAGFRAFSVGAPVLWNNLPNDLRNTKSLCTFKRNLKTHLFEKAFDC